MTNATVTKEPPPSFPDLRRKRRLHRAADWLDAWHITRIMNAVSAFAILLAITALAIDMVGRTEERIARAWQLVTTRAPGNSGKIQALEYLNSEVWWWPFKRRVPLVGINLSPDTRHGDAPVFLAEVQLAHAELSGANLRGADLALADLSLAQLSGADLQSADLALADLRGTKLDGTDLRGADVASATLSGAWLSNADLGGASLNQANLSGAELSNADLRGADLTFANLSGADLGNADLRGANLAMAKLVGTILNGAILSSAILSHADLGDTNLSGADLRNVEGIEQPQLNAAWAWKSLPPKALPDGLMMRHLCTPADLGALGLMDMKPDGC